MQIHDLVTPIDQLTEEQLHERLREIRHRREVIRPAAKARVDRAEKKTTQAKTTKVSNMVAKLSDADRLALIAALTQGA